MSNETVTRYFSRQLTREESVAILREQIQQGASAAAADICEEIADYLESTADDMTREADQEIAMAYATPRIFGLGIETRQGVWRGLRAAGLTR